jgi:uncharacterized damage-inducible protein DinB
VIREFDFIFSAMMACIEMLLGHNRACRRPILDAVKNLTRQELGVGNGSIRDILIHMVNVEDYWTSLLRGTDVRKFNPKDFDKVDSVAKIWLEVEAATKEFLEYQTEKSLQVVRNVKWNEIMVYFTVVKALIHMATHEIHHRGLIICLIGQLVYNPPNVQHVVSLRVE